MNRQVLFTLLIVVIVPMMSGCDCCNPQNQPTATPTSTATPSSTPTPTATPTPTPLIEPTTGMKIAVLASALEAKLDDHLDDSQFWYDLVLSYCTLIEHGFQSDDIFVLYGEGNDSDFSTYDAYLSPYCGVSNVPKIVDFPLVNSKGGAKDNLCNVLCCLSTGHPATLDGNDDCICPNNATDPIGGFACTGTDYTIPELDEHDFLFTWIKGHGNAINCNQISLAFYPVNSSNQNPPLDNKELAGLLEPIKDNRKAMIFETCDSSGWLGELQNPNTAVASSSGNADPPLDCIETSYPGEYTELPGDESGIFHGRFTHGFNAALRKLASTLSPVDTDGNNLVSIQESFDETVVRINAENDIILTPTPPAGTPNFGQEMNPAIRLEDGIAPCLFIRLPLPGKDHEIFSKDHTDDRSLVPSTSGDPESIDVWVIDLNDGSTTNNLKRGETYSLSTRVYNIGCAEAEMVTASFSLLGIGGIESKSGITSNVITTLPAVESSVIPSTWTVPTDIVTGDYFLVAALSIPEDLDTSDQSVVDDNNKAQIKIAIVP